MSIKTLRKRIALVAVSTMGVGVLSVAPANASIAVGTVTGNGIIVALAGSGTSQTITISSESVLNIPVSGGSSGAQVNVSGGTITSVSGAAVLSTNTSATVGTDTVTVSVKPNAGEGIMVVSTCTSSANCAAGTNTEKITATIKAASSVGVISSAYSFVQVVTAAHDTDPTNNVDTSTATNVPVGTNGRINFDLFDGNNVAMASGTAVTATATGGCLVGILNATTSFLSTSATALYSDATVDGSESTGYNDAFFFARSVTNAPFTCTVTLTANGVQFATKTLKLLGKVTKVEVDGGQAGSRGGRRTHLREVGPARGSRGIGHGGRSTACS